MKTALLVLFCLAVPFSAFGADKLIVKDSGGTTKFVVTDTGRAGLGTATPSGQSLHVLTNDVALLNDIFSLNQVAGVAYDIQTGTGVPPSGAVQAVNNEFQIRYVKGSNITNNFNTFRMLARVGPTVTDNITGHVAAANFQAQHNGLGALSGLYGFITNVAIMNTGNATAAIGIRSASPQRTGTGTITNMYGLNIQQQAVTGVTNGWGIYQEGSTDNNYFAGNIGVGVTNPTYPIQLSGGAYTNGSAWLTGSSRTLKENINTLSAQEAVETLNGLNPVKYNYKTDKEESYVGFIAEDVPELVATKDRNALSAMDIVAVLTKVVQEQRKSIDALQDKLNKIERQVNSLK